MQRMSVEKNDLSKRKLSQAPIVTTELVDSGEFESPTVWRRHSEHLLKCLEYTDSSFVGGNRPARLSSLPEAMASAAKGTSYVDSSDSSDEDVPLRVFQQSKWSC